jgi:phage gp29-like protein
MITGANPEGETLPDQKFWRLGTGATHGDEPYGLGLAHWLYWPVMFKRQGLRYWLMILEKFGAPTAVGKFPQNATPEERANLLAATQAIQSDSGVILPEGMVIELLEASRGGTPGHESMIRLMDSAIAKVVLSQTMTTDSGSSEAQARVHQDVAQAVVKADADLVCGSFNRGPARWLTDWNYPGAAYPRVWRRVEDEEDLKPLAERDKILFDMGFRPTLSYIKETYGGDWTEAKPAGAPVGAPLAGAQPETPAEPAAFAERADKPTAVDALTQALAEQTAPAWSAMLDRIRAIVDQHIDDWQSLEALRDALLAAYGDLPVDDLAEVMSAGFALAELAGRFDVREERAP